MKVYVLQAGIYSDTHVIGVFSSLAKAKEGQPVAPDGWDDEEGYSTNGLDWGESREVIIFDLDTRA